MSTTTANAGAGSDDSRATLEALYKLGTLEAVGALASFAYGANFSFRAGLLALLTTLLGFAIGGLAGFLFGFPRYTESTRVANADDLPKPGEARSGKTASDPGDNTNLERIVDWLTTMIVGATLVNIGTIIEWSTNRFASISRSISGDASAVPGALLVLPFMIAGFLHLYLWARRYLLDDWTKANRLRSFVTLAVKTQVDAAVTSKVDPVAQNLRKSVNRVDMGRALALVGVDGATIAEVDARLRAATRWEDDPFEGFGPSEAESLKFEATVTDVRSQDLEGSFRITLAVSHLDEPHPDGEVHFLLHNTYDESMLSSPLQDGKASVEIYGEEAFVCGAIVVLRPQGSPAREVRLALDLARIPGVPPDFLPRT